MKVRHVLLSAALVLSGVVAEAPTAGAEDPPVGTGATKLTVTANHTVYAYGDKARVTIYLTSPTTDRTVKLFLRYPDGTRKPIVKLTVPASTKKVTTTVGVTKNAYLRAEFAGDEAFAPAVAEQHFNVRQKLVWNSASTSMSGIYHRLKGSPSPTITATITPLRPGACVNVSAIVLVGNHWVDFGSKKCLRTTSRGRISIKLNNFKPGDHLKVSAVADQTPNNIRSLSVDYRILIT